MEKIFYSKKVGKKEVTKFQMEFLYGLRTKMDPRHEKQQSKVGWTMQDCYMSRGGLFELAYKVNIEFVKYDCIQPQFLKRFCGEPL